MMNFENSYKCIEPGRFDSTYEVAHCARYSRFTDAKIACVQCKPGYALIQNSNTCVTFADCSGTVVIGQQDEDYDFSIFQEQFVVCDTVKDKNVCAVEAVGNSNDYVLLDCV